MYYPPLPQATLKTHSEIMQYLIGIVPEKKELDYCGAGYGSACLLDLLMNII